MMQTILTEFNVCDPFVEEKQEYKMVVSNPLYKSNVTNPMESFRKILSHVYLTIQATAYARYKSSVYLQLSDIENIKQVLKDSKEVDPRIIKFKENIEADLMAFKGQVEEKYTRQIKELQDAKTEYKIKQNQVKNEKNQLLSNFATKLRCIFTTESKKYDEQIATLQTSIDRCNAKMKELKAQTPMATEQDVVFYQLHLKEKYAKVFDSIKKFQ